MQAMTAETMKAGLISRRAAINEAASDPAPANPFPGKPAGDKQKLRRQYE